MKRISRSIKRALLAFNLDLFKHEDLNRFPNQGFFPVSSIRTRIKRPDKRILEREKISLPDVKFLYQMYEHYNWLYFEGKLPGVKIEYSERMLSAGSYTPGTKLIKIGRKYHEIFPQDLSDTLKHEMIHILHIKHDSAFKALARRIGATVRAKSHPSLRRPPKYVYECPSCKAQYHRQKILRMASCGKCSGGKFNNRFKLKRLKN